MTSWLDKIEVFLVKSFLVLLVCLLVCQYIIGQPRWADALILLNRLEGVVYTYGGLQ